MSKKKTIIQEVQTLYSEGAKIAVDFEKEKSIQFQYDYQRWYTKSLKTVASLAPDRLEEFRKYYEVDSKRKSLGYGTYVIQDFFKGVVPGGYQYSDFDARKQVFQCFFNQLTIFAAIAERVGSVLGNIEGELYSDLQDSELEIAQQLSKISLRAAGALVGVVIEGHLQKVATDRGITVTKKNPTIADLNEPLKAASVIDLPTWRKISFLADIRNICCHRKDVEPTKEQIKELIDGAGWLTKNVF